MKRSGFYRDSCFTQPSEAGCDLAARGVDRNACQLPHLAKRG